MPSNETFGNVYEIHAVDAIDAIVTGSEDVSFTK